MKDDKAKSCRSCLNRLPVFGEVDVLVAGGGPAGLSAGFAAARRGFKTLIAEQFNCLGGVATAGGHGHICLFSAWADDTRVVGGILWEAARRVARAGYGICDNSNADFEIEGMKLVLEQMAAECGAGLLYHTFCAEALMEGGKAAGAVVQNKTGRGVIKAKRVIDCTGDGDLAASAGCSYDYGDEESGACQPMTLMFTIGGVDWEKVRRFRGNDWQLAEVWEKAQKAGDMRPFQKNIMGWWWTPTRPGQVGVNFTHINGVSAISAEDLTAATIEGRKQAYETIEVYRKYIPGMEKCHMVSTPNTAGTRESRRVRGLYTLTREDVVRQAVFPDSIGYGSFFIDIHNVKGPGMDEKTWRPEKGFKYQIPYRVMVPLEGDNLWVAGRCASAAHEALGSLRVMPQCGVMGEAAGTAAALSIREDCSPKDLDAASLQAGLRENGCILDENGIAAARNSAKSNGS